MPILFGRGAVWVSLLLFFLFKIRCFFLCFSLKSRRIFHIWSFLRGLGVVCGDKYRKRLQNVQGVGGIFL